jgi:NhaP-type Na+/H+ or K+/H+ antiporter
MLLIMALFTSYILQQKKIQAIHETVISIFAGAQSPVPPRPAETDHGPGMVVGLVIRVTPGTAIQDSVSFDYQFFFNLLLPPIILASGYELHQVSRDHREKTFSKTDKNRPTSSATSVLY